MPDDEGDFFDDPMREYQEALEEEQDELLAELHGPTGNQPVETRTVPPEPEPPQLRLTPAAPPLGPNSILANTLRYTVERDLGLNIHDDYLAYFGNTSYMNVLFAKGTFHLIVGQLPNVRKIRLTVGNSYLDTRFHLCYFSPSGTGKGEGANVVSDLCKKLDMKYKSTDELTTAALVGTIYLDPRTQAPVTEYGLLSPRHGNRILAATEAGILLNDKPGEHAKNLLDYLQKTMNTQGTPDNLVSKKLSRGESIEYHPDLALFLTTYPTTGLREIVLTRGILQRMCVLVNSPNAAWRKRVNQMFLEKALKKPQAVGPLVPIESIATRLKYVDARYANVTTMELDPACEPVFLKLTEDLFKSFEWARPFAWEVFETFVTRYDKLAYKLAVHYACLNLHDKVMKEDAELACDFMADVFRQLVAFLELKMLEPREYTQQTRAREKRFRSTWKYLANSPRYLGKKGWVIRSDLVRAYMERHRYSQNATEQDLDRLITFGVFKQKVLTNPAGLHIVKLSHMDEEGDSTDSGQ